MEIPDQETLQDMPMFTGHDLQGGTHEDPAMLGVPEHIREAETITAPPVDTHITPHTPAEKPKTIAGAPVRPGAADSLHGGGLAATAPPPPSRLPIDPMTPGLSEEQQARARFGAAPMDKVREHLERTNQLRYLPQTDYAREGRVPSALPEPSALRPTADVDRMREYQQTMGDPYQTRLFDPTQPWMQKSDNLVNVVEMIQIDDAMGDMAIMKHVPTRELDERSITDILLIAKRMDISPMDVRTILNTKGDWERITKTYGYNDETIKVVKVSFGGI